MAFPANPTAHPFVPRSGSYPHTQTYPHTFVNFSNSDDVSVPCQQCSNNAIVATNLQTRVSVLDMQLSKIQKDNADAEMTIRYLLGLNASAKNEPYAIYTARQVASELRHKLKQEVAEKECIKVMLESALNKIVHLHRARELESSQPSVSPESTLFEHDISSVTGIDDVNDVHCNETAEKEPRGEGVGISVQDFSKLESDSASASSYMFHFVNDSSDEDKIIMMKENATKANGSHGVACKHIFIPVHESGSEGGLTAINSATVGLSDLDNQRSISSSPGTKLSPTENGATPLPLTGLGDSVPATENIAQGDTLKHPVKRENFHGLGSLTAVNKLESPARLHETEAKVRELIDLQQRRVGLQDRKVPDMFKHPYAIQYIPAPGTRNLYRTLVISNLPHVTTMTALLDQVRGGVIFDAKLLNTTTITGGKTALVTFLHQRNAEAFEAHAKRHPIVIQDRTAKVTLLKTANWPSPLSQRAMLEGNRTRCLEVTEYPRHVTCSDLRRKLRVCSVMKVDRIEHVALRYDGILALRFDSIADAWKAQGMFASSQEFRGCVVRFAIDPCAKPIGAIGLAGSYGYGYEKMVHRPVTIGEVACSGC